MEERMKGKKIGLAGSIISIIFSFISLFIAKYLKTAVNDEEFIEGIRDSYQNSNASVQEADDALKMLEQLSNFGETAAIIFIIIGLIALIAIIRVNQNNKKKVGVSLIVISISHLMLFRFLAFVLLLIGGIQLTKKELESDQPDESFFNELKE